jgi:hypothetical protein
LIVNVWISATALWLQKAGNYPSRGYLKNLRLTLFKPDTRYDLKRNCGHNTNLLKNVKCVIARADPNSPGSGKLELRASGEGGGVKDNELTPLTISSHHGGTQ